MAQQLTSHLSTGIEGLDHVIRGLVPGDNIVWQVDSSKEYQELVVPYSKYAQESGQHLIYFRFASHGPLVPEECGAQIYELDPSKGFEAFVEEVHQVINKSGRGGYYVFDCLSELAEHWHSDQMLGNFFMLTCPYLLDIEALAYFALYRDHHSFHATAPILETTQLFMDVYRHKGEIYVHPMKVQHRYSPTMHMLHVWRGDDFSPVPDSATISEVRTSFPWNRIEASNHHLGTWNRAFIDAEEAIRLLQRDEISPDRVRQLHRKLINMLITRNERMFQLIEKYLSLEDVVEVGKRVLGTGLIGGKTVGMLLARAILKQADECWQKKLEPHDSFYIGSDVFYTFLVKNGIWWALQSQKDPEAFLEGSHRARQRMLVGTFPEHIEMQFNDMLNYFGQSPFIVRSSSLLEDNYGNAFAGKYESIFCVNRGPREKRLEDFKSAVRAIYASMMSERALVYRARRGLLQRDEQMALLVQRVSGSFHSNLFFPQVAGVGFSYNPYVWSDYIDPNAGVLRLVFGLGTRAVDRSDDDYARIVALNAPTRRPEENQDEAQKYTQKQVDVLDLEANQLVSYDFSDVMRRSPEVPIDLFATRDRELERRAESAGIEIFPWMLTFDRMLKDTDFVADMKQCLLTLQKAYDYPVDIEFTTNFLDDDYQINLLQCRPLQVQGGGTIPKAPAGIANSDMIFEAHGAVIGQSRVIDLDWLVYVVPSEYGEMAVRDRHAVSRLIGNLMHSKGFAQNKEIALLGPGRWGTSTPSLGVPISFNDISPVTVLCEIVAMRKDLVPDASLGTHLFSELVEMEILYLALFPDREGNLLNDTFFKEAPNRLVDFVPDGENLSHVVRVIDVSGGVGKLYANTLEQKVICYRAGK
ncbi:MAG: hypothetical protein JW936_08440 [Sedimentisphaerales bacterium]|nr:hypothetical protein [Sedimentisphaerales bacterium]